MFLTLLKMALFIYKKGNAQKAHSYAKAIVRTRNAVCENGQKKTPNG